MNSVICVLLGLLVCAQACQHDGKTYQNGEEWTVRNSFIMRCTIEGNGWRTQVVACFLPDINLRIPLNSSRTHGDDVWSCNTNRNGVVELKAGINPNKACDGHPVGSRWQDKAFELECKPGGLKVLTACVSESGDHIAVNSSKEIDGFILMCQQFANGTVLFHGAKSLKAPRKFNYDTHIVTCLDEQSNERAIGSHWIENHRFNKTCKPGGAVEVVNCITKDGKKVPLNGAIVFANVKYSCEMTDQGTIRYAAGPVN